MSFEVGQTAGGYEFVAVEDNARTGEIYKVRNVIADRFEVLRVLPKEMQDREHVDRFLREIKVHARLGHPNIVSFYNAIEIENQLVMTCEFFEAETLEKRLEAGRIPVKEAIACMSQVLAALGHAHEHGITHREVSPVNILIGPDGTVKLTGFGLAKGSNDPQLTQAGMVMGWLDYMSPEQVKGLASLDARADIYSAGAVLYEMVTGQVPFVRKSQFEVMMAHVNTPPEPPIGLNPDLPLDLSQVILTAMAKDPDQRFQTAGYFRQALNSVDLNPPVPEPQPLPGMRPLPEAPPPAEPWGFERLVITGVMTFILVAVIFFAYLKIVRP